MRRPEWNTNRESNDNYARISNDHVAIARNVAGGGIFHELSRFGAKAPCCGQHDDRWSEPAHAYVLLGDDIEQAVGVHCENSFNRAVILDSRYRVRFVMIHIARRDDQYTFRILRDHIGYCDPKLLEHLELTGSERDRHKSKIGLPQPEKW